jgi:hypothetical protein
MKIYLDDGTTVELNTGNPGFLRIFNPATKSEFLIDGHERASHGISGARRIKAIIEALQYMLETLKP